MKSLLQQSGQLERLIEQTQLYEALLSVGQEVLPDKIAKHLVGVSFEEQTLLLQIDDNLWITKLRFYEAELLGIYQSHFPHIRLNKVKIQVIPIAEKRKPKPKKIEHPTEEMGKEFIDLSKTIEHKGLKSALEKLAARAEKK